MNQSFSNFSTYKDPFHAEKCFASVVTSNLLDLICKPRMSCITWFPNILKFSRRKNDNQTQKFTTLALFKFLDALPVNLKGCKLEFY